MRIQMAYMLQFVRVVQIKFVLRGVCRAVQNSLHRSSKVHIFNVLLAHKNLEKELAFVTRPMVLLNVINLTFYIKRIQKRVHPKLAIPAQNLMEWVVNPVHHLKNVIPVQIVIFYRLMENVHNVTIFA